MGKYQAKPVVIEALQWDGSWASARAIINTYDTTDITFGMGRLPSPNWLSIETLEGVMRASPGDYIVKGTKGELYPCKPDIFEAKYERVLT